MELLNGDDINTLLSESELSAINKVIDDNAKQWADNPQLTEQVKPGLMRLCAHYLLKEKSGIHAKNRVANFHLSNGARVERINWLADTSETGMNNSFGLMVNYFYKLSHIERNHETYVGQGEIARSSAVRGLLK